MPRFRSCLVLVVAAGLFLPAAAQGGKGGKGKGQPSPGEGPTLKVDSGETPVGRGSWKPDFDYTHLPPASETLWAELTGPVDMVGALAVAAEALGGPVWAKKATISQHEGHPAWSLQLFAASAGSEAPRRADLVVSCTEPRVLARTDLPSLSAEDAQIWNNLGQAKVQAEGVISLAKESARGELAEPKTTESHMRWLEWVNSPKPHWLCELMCIEGGHPRRYSIEVRGSAPSLRQRIMLDRFPGTPLRREQPVELDNGMFLHDHVTGDGPAVTRESKVTVQYRLFLLDNTKLHDTWRNNLPETFPLTAAPLKGMTEGMVGMRAGGKRKIAMPYELAFGEKGNEIVPPRAMVVCDISVIEVLAQ